MGKKQQKKKLEAHASNDSGASFDFLGEVFDKESETRVVAKKKSKPVAKKTTVPKASTPNAADKPSPAKTTGGGGGKSGSGFRDTQKRGRFVDRVEGELLKTSQMVRQFGSNDWRSVKAAMVQNNLKKCRDLLFGDKAESNWELFQGTDGLLDEKGLSIRKNCSVRISQLEAIHDVMSGFETSTEENTTAFIDAVVALLGIKNDSSEKQNFDDVVVPQELVADVNLKCFFRELKIDEGGGQCLLALSVTTEAKARQKECDLTGQVPLFVINETEEQLTARQVDLWLSGFTMLFRNKENGQKTLKLCNTFLSGVDDLACPTEVKESVSIIRDAIQWLLEEDQGGTSVDQLRRTQEQMKGSAKLLRQFCNLPLGVHVTTRADAYQALVKKINVLKGLVKEMEAITEAGVTLCSLMFGILKY